MPSRWMLSPRITQVLLAATLASFLSAEAIVAVALLGSPGHNPFPGAEVVRSLLLNALLTSIPAVAGFWGCSVVNRLRLKIGAEQEDVTFVWLSRQFLTAAVFSYAALISIVVSVTGAFHPR